MGVYVLICSLLVVSPHLQSLIVYLNVLRYPFGDLTDLRRFGLSYRLGYTDIMFIHTYICTGINIYILQLCIGINAYVYVQILFGIDSALTYIHTYIHTYRTARNIAIVTEDGLTLKGWHLIPPIEDIRHNPLCAHLNLETEGFVAYTCILCVLSECVCACLFFYAWKFC